MDANFAPNNAPPGPAPMSNWPTEREESSHAFPEPCFSLAEDRIRGYLDSLCTASDLLDTVAGCAVNCARHSDHPIPAILDHLAATAGLSQSELRSKGDAGRETRRDLIQREMEQARRKLREAGIQADPAPVPAAVGDDDSDEPQGVGPLSCDIRLADLTRPPGLVGKIVDWIEDSAEYPSRELALGAALGWVATLAGRGFETPSRARTNLYMVSLAPSGFGKDYGGSCIMSLAHQVGLDRFIGPDRFMSASGLRNSLVDQPSLLSIQDEFGGIIRQIDGPKAGAHDQMIRVDMLKLFSRAKDFYAGAAYAASAAVKLFNPNLSIYGMSTPDDFWSALSSARTADGFLPRFLLFNVEGAKPERVRPAQSSGKAPACLVEASRAIYQAVYGSGNLAGAFNGTFPQDARVVALSADAEAVLGCLEAKIRVAEDRADNRQIPILNRTREHALKLALTIAVGLNPAEPEIDADAMQWGADLAWLSTCALAEEIDRHVADNDRQRDFKRLVEIVRKAGANGLTRSILIRRLGATMDKRRREELIEEAQDTKRIETRFHQPKVGRPSARFFAC
ncbi:DUF3987 domain-containing protein [Methylobacterium sp. WL18]|uniref:DUF3987 domain-containing protein n=1 Tax=Methylobacterium sp. WL18 TaxID=2603897 RepID=UPI0011C886DC|nr:DUF3987 domain-containing protein [Methylobacterium sp. WL18]TXN75094.1 DUF3987 domain-containing protein [Methylobacterium sp. WL18]